MGAAESHPEVGATDTSPSRPRSSNAARGTAVAVIAALLITAAWVGRRLWFFSDDWNIYADYHSGNLLEPFNGHLSLVPAGIYQMLFHTAGVGSYVPYRICGLVALGVLGFQVARWASTRVGPWPAVLAVTAVLWNSFGTTNVMFPFLMNFSLPMAALVAVWWHMDRLQDTADPAGSGERWGVESRHLLAVSLWLALALAASGLGVVAAGAVLAELLLRRAPWRRWLAVLAPIAIWLLWWLSHRGANEISTDVGEVVAYAARMLWAGTTSLAAGSEPGGLVLAALLVLLLVSATMRVQRLDARLAGAVGAALLFAGLTALTRQDTTPPIPPDELRYGWTIGGYLVLAAVAAARCLRPGAGPDHGDGGPTETAGARPCLPPFAVTAAAVLAVAVLGVGAIRLQDRMDDWSETVAEAAPGLRSNIYAAEAVGDERMAPGTVIGPLSFVPVTAESYLGAVADVGSPLQGATQTEIGGRPDQRAAADEILFGSLDFELTSVPVPAAERICAPTGEALAGDQVLVRTGAARGAEAVREPELHLSRFGPDPAMNLAVEHSGVLTLAIPADAPVGTTTAIPYQLSGTGGVEVCVPA